DIRLLAAAPGSRPVQIQPPRPRSRMPAPPPRCPIYSTNLDPSVFPSPGHTPARRKLVARTNLLRSKLGTGRTLVGPLCQEFWSPELFEFCGLAGFDFVIADGEHAGVDPQGVRNLARAAQGVGATVLCRLPTNDASLILRYLDAGVEGLILPHCNTRADADAFGRPARYPPRGIRGAASPSRAADYGFAQTPRQHVDQADREVFCLGLIEEPQAVANLPEILRVDGLDGCFVGAGDMAL